VVSELPSFSTIQNTPCVYNKRLGDVNGLVELEKLRYAISKKQVIKFIQRDVEKNGRGKS
jgi:hypothetical protein